METVHKIIVQMKTLHCPYCDADVDGWVGGDPRGSVETCDECDENLR